MTLTFSPAGHEACICDTPVSGQNDDCPPGIDGERDATVDVGPAERAQVLGVITVN